MNVLRLGLVSLCIICFNMLICCITQNKGTVNNENNLYFGNYEDRRELKDNNISKEIIGEAIFESNKNIKGGDVKMESDISNLITVITSAIAGVYCAIKTIINLVKKLKGGN